VKDELMNVVSDGHVFARFIFKAGPDRNGDDGDDNDGDDDDDDGKDTEEKGSRVDSANTRSTRITRSTRSVPMAMVMDIDTPMPSSDSASVRRKSNRKTTVLRGGNGDGSEIGTECRHGDDGDDDDDVSKRKTQIREDGRQQTRDEDEDEETDPDADQLKDVCMDTVPAPDLVSKPGYCVYGPLRVVVEKETKKRPEDVDGVVEGLSNKRKIHDDDAAITAGDDDVRFRENKIKLPSSSSSSSSSLCSVKKKRNNASSKPVEKMYNKVSRAACLPASLLFCLFARTTCTVCPHSGTI
jgi:hypothetical protein